jgi:hypothetical protein
MDELRTYTKQYNYTERRNDVLHMALAIRA